MRSRFGADDDRTDLAPWQKALVRWVNESAVLEENRDKIIFAQNAAEEAETAIELAELIVAESPEARGIFVVRSLYGGTKALRIDDNGRMHDVTDAEVRFISPVRAS